MSRPTRSPRHPAQLAILAACVALATIACGGPDSAEAPAPVGPEPEHNEPTIEQPTLEEVSAEGILASPERAQDAFTYNPALAPEGARLSVEAGESDGATTVRLAVNRLQPDRGYAAHAHARPCGPSGADAGPHFQNDVDPAATPEQPSTDPAFANPRNEIWLDLRTDAMGNGEASTEVPFTLTDRAPASVIVHEAESTATAPGEAGTAGGRLACLNVPFHQAASGR